MQAEIAVPPPGSDSTSSVPDRSAIRCRIAIRPKPPRTGRVAGIESDAVVAHVERDLVVHVGNGQPDPGRVRVPGHVRERLLGGAQQRELDLRRHRPCRAGRLRPAPGFRSGPPSARRRRPAPRSAGSVRAARGAARPPTAAPRRGCPAPAGSRPRHAAATLRDRRGRLAACSAACSWVTIPVSPCASVSWISRAIRCRSSSTPASRAWAISCRCRSSFSAMSRRGVRWPRSGPPAPACARGPAGRCATGTRPETTAWYWSTVRATKNITSRNSRLTVVA